MGSSRNDYEVIYRSPGTYCEDVRDSLTRSECELEIQIKRQTRWEFERLQEQGERYDAISLSPSGEDACRTYAAIYGESCEEALERMR